MLLLSRGKVEKDRNKKRTILAHSNFMFFATSPVSVLLVEKILFDSMA